MINFKIGQVYTLKKNLSIYFENMNGQEINTTIEYLKNSCFDVISINESEKKVTVEFESDYNNTINGKDIHVTMNIDTLLEYTIKE